MKKMILALSLAAVAFSTIARADEFDDRAHAAQAKVEAQREQLYKINKETVTEAANAEIQKLGSCHGGILQSSRVEAFGDGITSTFIFAAVKFVTGDNLACSTNNGETASCKDGPCTSPYFNRADCYDANDRPVSISCP